MNEETVKITTEVRKCWVRDSKGSEWFPRWVVVSESVRPNECVDHVDHECQPTPDQARSRMGWTYITFTDPNAKPATPTGAELVGRLCGVSITSIENAKARAEAFCYLSVIERYSSGYHPYVSRNASDRYAYPVDLTKLAEATKGAE